MSGIISLLVGAIQFAGVSLLPSSLLARVPSPTIAWVSIGVACIFLAAYLAWRDERREVERIESDLADERSIKDAPEVYLHFRQIGGAHTGFVVSNKSGDRNANRISIGRIETKEWLLDTETIDLLAAHQELPIKARMFHKSDGSQEMYPDYKKLFADLCGNEFDIECVLTLEFWTASGLAFARQVTAKTNLIRLEGDVKDAFKFSHDEIRKL